MRSMPTKLGEIEILRDFYNTFQHQTSKYEQVRDLTGIRCQPLEAILHYKELINNRLEELRNE
jgi:hypothetical protein